MPDNPLAALTTYRLDSDVSPADEAAIAAFEEEIGGGLPTAYRRFLAASAPVGIEGASRFPLKGGESASISALYGLACDSDWDVRHQTMQIYPGRIPDETVAIGEDGDSGDLVLLVFDGPRRGEVCIWFHDHPEIAGDRLDAMRADLAATGADLGRMDDAAVIHAWEHAHADELGRPPLWGNVEHVADSFEALLELLAGGR